MLLDLTSNLNFFIDDSGLPLGCLDLLYGLALVSQCQLEFPLGLFFMSLEVLILLSQLSEGSLGLSKVIGLLLLSELYLFKSLELVETVLHGRINLYEEVGDRL